MNERRSSVGAENLAVLVPGLWMSGWSMALIARQLKQSGRRTRMFSYRSLAHDVEFNAEALRRFIGDCAARRLDFVGHSLGGLVLLTMLQSRSDFPPGRVVLLGTPLRGSRVSRTLSAWPPARPLLGRSAAALQRGIREWSGSRPVGVIAGRLPVGLGRLVPGLAGPSDGTVALEETRLPGLDAHLTLPVSHTSLLLAPSVARETVQFLDTGRFSAAR